jgi:lipoic acid synthetase
MSDNVIKNGKKPRKLLPGVKLRSGEKVRQIPTRNLEDEKLLRKPDWIRIRLPTGNEVGEVQKIKKLLRENKLSTVCEEASCPNLHECFSGGTATFMIMGDICTRRCSFCDVAHGRPKPLDVHEPENLAAAIAAMGLRYVVITSVDRDDLDDGGALHFVNCIRAARKQSPQLIIETLVPDFRTCQQTALDILMQSPPDIFNHNLETVPRLYKEVRPGANYQQSLDLLKNFTDQFPRIPGKSGLMLGLGEEKEEVIAVMQALRKHGVSMLTLGQYLQPSKAHLTVKRYITPAEFAEYKMIAEQLEFKQVASGPLVRSSYHADLQAKGEVVS